MRQEKKRSRPATARGSRKPRASRKAKGVAKKIRYAVVGLGHISQVAVLPAFQHAKTNCQLTALVSDSEDKLKKLGRKYNVKNLYSYERYDELMTSGLVDAVYIALPNSLHAEYTIRAAEAGIHVLCEKPMAVSSIECEKMIDACRAHTVRLMVAYRLHLAKSNLEFIKLVRSGKFGEPVFFNSSFSMQVRGENIRTNADLGGGALFDIGIYCLNEARQIFDREPTRVSAVISNPDDKRFDGIDGLTSVILEFGTGKVASFICSFGAAGIDSFHLVGTKGSIHCENGYEYAEKVTHELSIKNKKSKKEYKREDQFAAQLVHFASAIIEEVDPAPSGMEGLADVRVIEAIFESAKSGRTLELIPLVNGSDAQPKNKSKENNREENKRVFSAVVETELVEVESPSVEQ